MEKNHYLNYQAMVAKTATALSGLETLCRAISMDAQAEELRQAAARLTGHDFSVGIMGEFRRGKSTVINALLGQQIVPSDIVPCSATLNYIRWDTEKRALIHFKNGDIQQVPVEELSHYVTKLTRESEAMAATVEDATVFYPCPFCQNGVQIVDTPGLNDDERMTAISEQVIPKLDAIIMVLVPDSPFSQSEAEFVRTKLMASDLGKLIFVVNKIDILDEEDRPRMLEAIRQKIQASVLDKMAAVYGADSPEYTGAKEKLGRLRVLPVSARQALRGKTRQRPDLLEESGYPEFEELLSKMLTQDRGLLQLLPPLNRLNAVARTALQTLQTRREALDLDGAEFEKISLASMEELRNTRSRKKEEVAALKARGRTVYAQLRPELDQVYPALEQALSRYVEEFPITEADVASEGAVDALSQRLSQGLDEQLEQTLALHTEKLIYKIRTQLGSDAEDLKTFHGKLEQSLGNIRQSIRVQSGSGEFFRSDTASAAIDVVTQFGTTALLGTTIPGVGGIISGFRTHGVKGAVAGGLTGAAIAYAAATLLTPLGITSIPFFLIAGAASTFGGKAVTNLIFGNGGQQGRQMDKLRESLRQSVHEIVEKLRQSGKLEQWLKDACQQAYEMLAADIDKEWELSLQNMEDTLTRIRIDLEMNQTNKEQAQQTITQQEAQILSVLESIQPLREKLDAVRAG